MAKKSASTNLLIVQIIVGAVVAIVVAYIGYITVIEPMRLSISATQTAEAKQEVSQQRTPTSTSTPIPTATVTFTPTNTATPLPSACSNGFFACVFPQGSDGKIFLYNSDPKTINLVADETASECGYTSELGVKLTYGVMQKGVNGAWGVQWKDTTGYLDASEYVNISFAVRGMTGNETFLIGLKDIPGKPVTLESKNYVEVSSSKWNVVVIPFSKFIYQGASVNPQALENMSFSFDERHGSGIICIDDIAFTK